MVVDTSALLALFFAEPHGEWVAEQLEPSIGPCWPPLPASRTPLLPPPVKTG